MITATFFQTADEMPKGFSLIGHAGYDVSGRDIVCAAVSALAINTVNSIERFTDDRFSADTDEETGLLTFTFEEERVSEKSVLLIRSLILGLQGIAEEYGDNSYLQILFKEV